MKEFLYSTPYIISFISIFKGKGVDQSILTRLEVLT